MSEDILDLAEFKERVQDDTELLLELLDIFAESLKSTAHSLKGASGNISAKKLRELFLKIEEMGKAGNAAGAKELLPSLDEAYGELTKRFEEVKKELAS